jgi:hypothetical protein
MNRDAPRQKPRQQTSGVLDSIAGFAVTFLVTLLSFAVSLLLGILALVIAARFHGVHPNMSVAYRYIALPVAAVVATVALISAIVMEIRNYSQTKVLAEIERIS